MPPARAPRTLPAPPGLGHGRADKHAEPSAWKCFPETRHARGLSSPKDGLVSGQPGSGAVAEGHRVARNGPKGPEPRVGVRWGRTPICCGGPGGVRRLRSGGAGRGSEGPRDRDGGAVRELRGDSAGRTGKDGGRGQRMKRERESCPVGVAGTVPPAWMEANKPDRYKYKSSAKRPKDPFDCWEISPNPRGGGWVRFWVEGRCQRLASWFCFSEQKKILCPLGRFLSHFSPAGSCFVLEPPGIGRVKIL